MRVKDIYPNQSNLVNAFHKFIQDLERKNRIQAKHTKNHHALQDQEAAKNKSYQNPFLSVFHFEQSIY